MHRKNTYFIRFESGACGKAEKSWTKIAYTNILLESQDGHAKLIGKKFCSVGLYLFFAKHSTVDCKQFRFEAKRRTKTEEQKKLQKKNNVKPFPVHFLIFFLVCSFAKRQKQQIGKYSINWLDWGAVQNYTSIGGVVACSAELSHG